MDRMRFACPGSHTGIACSPLVRDCGPVPRVGFLLFLDEEIYSVTDSKASISWPCISKLIYRVEKKMQIYVDTR